MSRRYSPDPTTAEVLKERDTRRAPQRALMALHPSDPWIERERWSLEAKAADAPKPIREPAKRRRVA